jgi:GNAT superfamily N-acetyltransferase
VTRKSRLTVVTSREDSSPSARISLANGFSLGQSGVKIADLVFSFLPPDKSSQIELTTVYVDRSTQQIKYENSIDDVTFDESPVLLIDSAVHSGQSMSQVIESLWHSGAKNILTYSLMVKRSSKMIPTYFAILVEDTDRVYFQLEEMPNNRLCEKPPFGRLKEVSDDDTGKEIGDVGAPFVGTTTGDLLYGKRTQNYHPYIYEYAGRIAGFVSFGKKGNITFIDAWGTTLEFRRKGIGGAMLRWAETWARSNRCEGIELWGFEGAIPIYQKYGYDFIRGEELNLSATHRYKLMGKRILYHIRTNESGEVIS